MQMTYNSNRKLKAAFFYYPVGPQKTFPLKIGSSSRSEKIVKKIDRYDIKIDITLLKLRISFLKPILLPKISKVFWGPTG